MNIINYKLNRYYYNCSLRKIYTYSLTERYQISENIQFAKVSNRKKISIQNEKIRHSVLPYICSDSSPFCNILLISTPHGKSSIQFYWEEHLHRFFWPTVYYFYSLLPLYSLQIQRHVATWIQEMREIGRIWNIWFEWLSIYFQYNSEVKCSSITIGKPSLQLKTTFGERMNLGKNVQMDIYFSQLTNSWNTMRPNEPWLFLFIQWYCLLHVNNIFLKIL